MKAMVGSCLCAPSLSLVLSSRPRFLEEAGSSGPFSSSRERHRTPRLPPTDECHEDEGHGRGRARSLHPSISCSPLALASSKKPTIAARREDIPFIKCQICEKKPREIQGLLRKEALVSPKKGLDSSIGVSDHRDRGECL
ncbi:hypothetical protein J5N97_025650 [Dioscorea zingiberensis]|uniref:Uncharacterized protein n=1 Tax=Dioscorea zingiberensis TaxID=325984 RepID=A0A9D5C1U2_9LILI|nr:hypothetical protein J5N97_025650 [Dioscorea zingiberensis]